MDDMAYPHLPPTSTDIESQQSAKYGEMHDVKPTEAVHNSRIVKTVSINQSSTNGS